MTLAMPTSSAHVSGDGRRLTVILAADIAGYSALMGEDEEATVRDLKGHQTVVLPMIANAGGRVIDTAGDGIFAEFPSVQRAVRCAVAMQTVMAERNREVDPARRMQFRIGINQAEVLSDQVRIYGDGVNIAARLESISEPGSIAISARVYDEVRDRWGLIWADAGEQSLKNIRHLVHVYRFKSGDLPPDAPEFNVSELVEDAKATSRQTVVTELPEVASIAVLPFTNMSGDQEQQYFADGITEDLITELSRFDDLIVIARNSTFQYKDRAVDIRNIGSELGVRYVLEGSTRRAGDRVRLNAQLINAADGRHLWADKYDRKIEDIFAIQDELVHTIIPILACQVSYAERERSRAKPEDRWLAHDFYLRAVDTFKAFEGDLKSGAVSANRIDESRLLIAKCLALDATYARAHVLLSATYSTKWAIPVDSEYLQPATMRKALESVETAIKLAPTDLRARAQYAHVLSFLQRRDRAYSEYRAAMRTNPHFTDWRFTSVCLSAGRPEEAIRVGEMLLRSDPFAPGVSLHFLGIANYVLGRYDVAAALYRDMVEGASAFPIPRRLLAACLAQMGNLDEARLHARIAIEADTNWTISRDFVPSVPQLLPDQVAAIVDGMKKAGLPEK